MEILIYEVTIMLQWTSGKINTGWQLPQLYNFLSLIYKEGNQALFEHRLASLEMQKFKRFVICVVSVSGIDLNYFPFISSFCRKRSFPYFFSWEYSH